MENLTIHPGRLEGQVRVSGAKNSALRLLAASLLTEEKITLENYPYSLLDAQLHTEMLENLGKSCLVEEESETIHITQSKPPSSELLWSKRSIRNTLLILGALTARTGKASVPLPGGCKLGERKYDIHVNVLESLGAKVWEKNGYLHARITKGKSFKGSEIHLPLRSTGATENALLCSSLAKGKTTIWGPHIRPEIMDLIELLRKMGVEITVRGQESIIIEGQESLKGATHRIIPDNVEALTWMIGAVITGGDIEIIDFPYEHLEVPLIHLRESGARFYRSEDRMIVRGGECYPIDISTGPYPGINSDMQPLFAVYAACAKGKSKIIDLRFPGRYAYAEELKRMGMDFTVKENLLEITGPTYWQGSTVKALDLRAGAALMLAGLMGTKNTQIENSWQISRGYHHLIIKLKFLTSK
ncbi:MAG: UDP-N-acetylglucosamine 1-carboxyvinyltransferase [Opitutales bacterium]|nr:UDP-N-acetylglucosamine 1-carboxyvinyltransferase [Opitutales bacterium]